MDLKTKHYLLALLHTVLAFLAIRQQQRGAIINYPRTHYHACRECTESPWITNASTFQTTAVVPVVSALEGFHCIPYSRLGYDSRTANIQICVFFFVLFTVKGKIFTIKKCFCFVWQSTTRIKQCGTTVQKAHIVFVSQKVIDQMVWKSAVRIPHGWKLVISDTEARWQLVLR